MKRPRWHSFAVGLSVLFAVMLTPAQPSAALPADGQQGAIRRGIDVRANPAALIRAANYLIRQGESQALHLLVMRDRALKGEGSTPLPTSFSELVSRDDIAFHVPECLLLTCYSPGGAQMPPPLVAGLNGREALMRPLTQSFPVLFGEGIPFVVDELVYDLQVDDGFLRTHSTAVTDLSEFVYWALGTAAFRSDVLVPPDDPFSVAISVITRAQENEAIRNLLGDRGLQALSRTVVGGALVMCEGCLDARLVSKLGPGFRREPHGSLLSACQETARELEMKWDKEKERYVVKDG